MVFFVKTPYSAIAPYVPNFITGGVVNPYNDSKKKGCLNNPPKEESIFPTIILSCRFAP